MTFQVHWRFFFLCSFNYSLTALQSNLFLESNSFVILTIPIFGAVFLHLKRALVKLSSVQRGIAAIQMNINWLKVVQPMPDIPLHLARGQEAKLELQLSQSQVDSLIGQEHNLL